MPPARLRPSLGCYGRVGVDGLGDFEEALRLQAGIREWLLRAARHGRRELRGLPAPAVLPLLCAAALGPALAEAAGLDGAAAVARIGVLSSVGASTLADAVAAAVDRVRSAHPSASPSRSDLQREISRSLREILSANDEYAGQVRSDIAMVLREIDAGGTAFRAAIEAGDEELEHEVLTAAETVSAEFGEMEFLLADLARAAGEIQDSLGGQGAELRAAIDQVARQSADVRVIREELAVMEQRGRPWMPGSGGPGQGGPRWTSGCPYRGLLPYGQAHEAVFFGREQLTAALAGSLVQSGLVMLTGASGAGKTSLLGAGLVPALARGVQVPGSASWPRIIMTPGTRPLTELAAQLAQLGGRDPAVIRDGLAGAPGDAHLLLSEIARAAGASRLVLIIDQFEQVFAAGDEEARLERAAFVGAVRAAATRPAGSRAEPPLLAVIAVRGDYWDRCAAYPQLIPFMERDQIVAGPMTEAELRRVITGPAEASGLAVEPGLADAILADLGSAGEQTPGGAVLPLLSQAMTAIWEHRQGDELTRQAYLDAGDGAGIARAVEVSAETAYRGLTEDQQAIAREVFRRLTGTGPDRRPALRAVSTSDLRAGRPAAQWPADQRGPGGVRPALPGRAGLRSHRDRARRPAPGLATAAGVAGRRRDQHDPVRPARRGHGAVAGQRRRPRAAVPRRPAGRRRAGRGRLGRGPGPVPPAGHRRGGVPAGQRPGRGSRPAATAGPGRLVTVVVVAALAGAGVAVKDARTSAARQGTANTAQGLAAQSTALDATDPVTAALLAGAAWRLDPTAQARYSLLQSLAQPVRGILTAPSGVVTALAYSPDGGTLAAGYSGGTIRLWDLASHRTIRETTFGAAPLALAFAGGGKLLEAADADAVGTWNLAAQAGIAARPLSSPAQGRAVAFSPDGATVATGSADGNVRLWNTATGQEVGAPMSSDANPVDAVAFSPDGALVASASTDGNVQLWSTAGQQVAGPALIPDGPDVDALAFSPDGKLLATGGQDGTARLWNVGSGSQAGAVMVTGNAVSALTFGAGGTTLATAENDGATELWGVVTQAQTGAPLAAAGSAGASALAFSPGTGAAGHRERQREHPAVERGRLPPALLPAGRRDGQPGRHVQRRGRPARHQRRAPGRPGMGHRVQADGRRPGAQLRPGDRAGPQPGRQDPGRRGKRCAAVADGDRPADRRRAASSR